MANYFSKYQGRGGPAIAPGIVQMMGSIGDEYAKGIAGLAEGIEKYRKNKEKREILTEKGEWVAEQKMKDLSLWVDEDPQRVDTPEYEEKLKDVQKFSEGIAEMPMGKLESAISNYALETEIDRRRRTEKRVVEAAEESRRRFDTEQGFRSRAESRALEDRKYALEDRDREEQERDAARAVGLGFAEIPTQTEFTEPGRVEERTVAMRPVEPEPAATPSNIIEEILRDEGHSTPATALEAKKNETQKAISEREKRLKMLGASRDAEGGVSIAPMGAVKTPRSMTFGPAFGTRGYALTPQERKRAEEIDAYNEAIKKDPRDMGREKSINTRKAQRAEATELYAELDSLKAKQASLDGVSAEEINQYLSPMTISAGEDKAPAPIKEMVWQPPTTQTRPTTQIERHRTMQEILKKHGDQLGVADLARFRKEMGKLDPNQPSPFRYEKGPNNTWLATHRDTGATVNLGQEGHMSATELGYLHRRAENQTKRLVAAKKAVREAQYKYETLAADVTVSEDELKPHRDHLERLKRDLEAEQPILEYGFDGWKN